MIRVVLVDDQAVVRAGFRVILESAGDISVVGEAASGPEAVTVVAEMVPDVVLMDIRMPGGNGIDATRTITTTTKNPHDTKGTGNTENTENTEDTEVTEVSGSAGDSGSAASPDWTPPPAVLVVTTFDLDDYLFGALEAGASGFVLKDADPNELIDAVRTLADGKGLLATSITRRVISEFSRRPASQDDQAAAHDLTPRELDIVRLLANGHSNDEIARLLFIETSTVKSHLTRAMTKLGTRDRLQTVVWFYRSRQAT